MTQKRSGGRPLKARSGQIEEDIVGVASVLFLEHGYGSVSIEKVAAACGISKRTFYHRFENKKELFAAVVHHLIGGLRPADVGHLFEGATLEIILRHLADIILTAALSSQALALHRIMISEAARFPELAGVMAAEGSKAEAITRIAQLLEHETRAARLVLDNPPFAAEQFLQMLIGVPQRRALGLGTPMAQAELTGWKDKTVAFFLKACGWNQYR